MYLGMAGEWNASSGIFSSSFHDDTSNMTGLVVPFFAIAVLLIG